MFQWLTNPSTKTCWKLSTRCAALASGIKNKNPQLDSDALTELTQRILDRIVFIRFLEDKLIEPDPIIPTFGKTKKGRTAWQDFLAASYRLDKIYNGVVFKYNPLLDTPDGLTIDEKAFADVLDAFDYDKSRYLFSDIPLHILGSIYERFLAASLSPPKSARLEPKPEVAQGGRRLLHAGVRRHLYRSQHRWKPYCWQEPIRDFQDAFRRHRLRQRIVSAGRFWSAVALSPQLVQCQSGQGEEGRLYERRQWRMASQLENNGGKFCSITSTA